ncbi:MAG: CAP domain-containing protein [Clostridium paraputrificum]
MKVDKVDGDKVTSSSGQTVKPSTKPPVVADNNNSNSKPSTGTEKPSTDNNSGNNNTNNSNSNNSNNNNNNSGTNKPSTGNNNGSSNNSGSTSKPQEPNKPTTPPVEKPKPEVKPEPPKRTWTYMADMSRETFNLMNKFRKDNGVAELKWSDSEHARAKKQAEYNAKNMDTGHDFSQISITSTIVTTPQQFINAWAKSTSHKQSMLEKAFIEGAVAVYKDSDGGYFVVASFNDGW